MASKKRATIMNSMGSVVLAANVAESKTRNDLHNNDLPGTQTELDQIPGAGVSGETLGQPTAVKEKEKEKEKKSTSKEKVAVKKSTTTKSKSSTSSPGKKGKGKKKSKEDEVNVDWNIPLGLIKPLNLYMPSRA